jgi:RNA polymerase sigma-70 factor (ECF subfamily)
MVLVLIEIEGYKHREVAEMLGISAGTSKSQLFYAKKKLKELLLKMEADERY